MQVLPADGDAVVVDDRVGFLCRLFPHKALGYRESALLHPVQYRHMRRDVVSDTVPQESCQLQDLRNLMRTYPRKGIE